MIAWSRKQAPTWTKAAYLSALKTDAMPRRIALVAEDSGEGHAPLVVDWKAPDFVETERPNAAEGEERSGRVVGFAIASLVPPQAELETIVIAAAEQRRGIGRKLVDCDGRGAECSGGERGPAGGSRLEREGAGFLSDDGLA